MARIAHFRRILKDDFFKKDQVLCRVPLGEGYSGCGCRGELPLARSHLDAHSNPLGLSRPGLGTRLFLPRGGGS